MVELLGHLELMMQEEKATVREKEYERYLSFLSSIFASPYADDQARKEFVQSIMPKTSEEQPQIQKQEWDFEMLEKLKSKQRGGEK